MLLLIFNTVNKLLLLISECAYSDLRERACKPRLLFGLVVAFRIRSALLFCCGFSLSPSNKDIRLRGAGPLPTPHTPLLPTSSVHVVYYVHLMWHQISGVQFHKNVHAAVLVRPLLLPVVDVVIWVVVAVLLVLLFDTMNKKCKFLSDIVKLFFQKI